MHARCINFIILQVSELPGIAFIIIISALAFFVHVYTVF